MTVTEAITLIQDSLADPTTVTANLEDLETIYTEYRKRGFFALALESALVGEGLKVREIIAAIAVDVDIELLAPPVEPNP
jgi:glycerate-2-kinase